MSPESRVYSHPDHITFCQNYTFWQTKTKTDEEGHLVRPWMDNKGNKIYACRGNFPGFNSYAIRTDSNYKPDEPKPGQPKWFAACPDRSDLVRPANSSVCSLQKYFSCKDNSTCIPQVGNSIA